MDLKSGGGSVSVLSDLDASSDLRGRVLSGRGIDDGPHRRDPVRGESPALGVLANQLLARRDVDAVDLVVRDEALHPLDLGAELLEHAGRLLRNPLELFPGEFADAGKVTFDDVLGHGGSPWSWLAPSGAGAGMSRDYTRIRAFTVARMPPLRARHPEPSGE